VTVPDTTLYRLQCPDTHKGPHRNARAQGGAKGEFSKENFSASIDDLKHSKGPFGGGTGVIPRAGAFRDFTTENAQQMHNCDSSQVQTLS
jgi:hypothetical protein